MQINLYMKKFDCQYYYYDYYFITSKYSTTKQRLMYKPLQEQHKVLLSILLLPLGLITSVRLFFSLTFLDPYVYTHHFHCRYWLSSIYSYIPLLSLLLTMLYWATLTTPDSLTPDSLTMLYQLGPTHELCLNTHRCQSSCKIIDIYFIHFTTSFLSYISAFI